MSTITHNGEPCAIGLTWLPPGTHPRTLSRVRKHRLLTAMRPTPLGYADLPTRDGAQTGLTTETSHLHLKPAAAMLAQAVATAIVITKLADNVFWLCAVEEGAVWPTGDLTGSRDKIAARLAEILQDDPDATVYDHTSTFHVTASVETFDDLLANSSPTETMISPLSSTRLPRKNIAIGTAVAILLAVGYFGWEHWQPDPSSAVQSDPAAQAAAALERERENVRANLSRDPGVLLAQFVDIIYDRPLHAAGWQLVRYEWRVDGALTARWQRRHGNLESLSDYLSTRTWTLEEPTGEIIETIPFETPLIVDETQLADMLDDGPGRHDFLDHLARFEGLWSLAAARPAGTHINTSMSTLTGSSRRLGSALSVAKTFLGTPVRITKLTATLEKGSSWKVEAEFYENG